MNEARTWDKLADRYDTIVRAFDRSYPAVRERLRRDLRGRERIIEVAAGTGQFTFDIAEVATRVLATDISPMMVERLRAELARRRVDEVEVAVMSAYALEVDDGSFDALFCANALHVMEEPRRALAEFVRILVPGGRLVLPTFLHGANGISRGVSRLLSLGSSFVAHSRFDLDSLRALLEQAGLRVERAEQLPGLFPLGYVVASASASSSSGLRSAGR